MPPKRSKRLALPRGKRTRYTKLGTVPVPSTSASEHTALEQTEAHEQGNIVVHKRKGRGLGKILDVRPPEKRPEVWPMGPDEFTTETTDESNPRQIVVLVTRQALELMPGPFRSFRMFDQITRDTLETRFLERFKYRAGENVKVCKEVLENLAAKRYLAELYEARRKCLDKFGWDTRSWKTMVPHWCTTPKYWEELCDIFAIEEFKVLSEQNKTNRCASGLTVCHFGGSASAYQHMQNLKNVLGRDPTSEEAYLHLHLGRENGISPIVAIAEANMATKLTQLEATNDETSGDSELFDPVTTEIIADVQTYDTSSMQFVNPKTKEVYEKAKEMQFDPKYAGREDIDLYRIASKGKCHGKDFGFGSAYESSMPIASSRSGHCHATPAMTTKIDKMLQDRDTRFAEEIGKRDKLIVERDDKINKLCEEQAKLQMTLNHLYAMFGVQQPTFQDNAGLISQPFQRHVGLPQGHGFVSQSPQGSHMSLLQGHDALPFTALMGMQVPMHQGLSSIAQANVMGGMQSLVTQGATTSEEAMGNWFEGSNQVNQHMQ